MNTGSAPQKLPFPAGARAGSDPSAGPSTVPGPGVSADEEIVPADVAEYIADVLAELREMAQASGQVPLSMLLDIARREAVAPGKA